MALVSFKKNRFQNALDFHKKYINSKMSVNALAKAVCEENVVDKESTFRRYLRIERMPEEMLIKVQDLLNVSEKYLTGEWNEKAPKYVPVSTLMSILQGDDIIAKRTDPDGVYILPAEQEKNDLLLSESIMQTRHYVNGTLRKYCDSGKWIWYSSVFDTQHYLELFRIFEKIVQVAAAQEIRYHPDHISLGAIFNEIKDETSDIIVVDLK